MAHTELSLKRRQVLEQLSTLIVGCRVPHPIGVAIDGPDAAGKTTLADELAGLLERGGNAVIRASIDGFHRPRASRHRRGEYSPDGYFQDSFDYEALRRHLLAPLGPNGDRRYRPRVFDFRSDAAVPDEWSVASGNAILLFDGVFLLRTELNDVWDFRVVVAVEFEEMLRRALVRYVTLLGSR